MHLKIERLFMHGTIFRHQWEWIKFGDEDLKSLEWALLDNPKRGKVIRDTGALRKTRFPFPYDGKQGKARFCYVEFEKQETIYLLAIFTKKQDKRLTPYERDALQWKIKLLEKTLNKKGKKPMRKAFDILSDALDEAARDAKGETTKLKRHRVKMEIPPAGVFSAEEIKQIRHQEGVPQRLFAEYLGVSKRTVEAWEIGRGKPTGPSSRLLALLKARKISIVE